MDGVGDRLLCQDNFLSPQGLNDERKVCVSGGGDDLGFPVVKNKQKTKKLKGIFPS